MEGAGELGVAVADQEAQLAGSLAGVGGEVAGRSRRPGRGWMRGDVQDVDVAVAGIRGDEHAGMLGVTRSTWEKSHAGSVPAWVRRKLRPLWSPALRGGGQAPGPGMLRIVAAAARWAQAAQLALDPLIAPRRVLDGQFHDQRGPGDRRPAVGPAPRGWCHVRAARRRCRRRMVPGVTSPAGTRLPGQDPDERGGRCAAGPVQARSGGGAPRHGDLVAEHQDLGVLGGAAAGHKREPGRYLAEHQVDQARRDSRRSWRTDERAMHRVPAPAPGAQ